MAEVPKETRVRWAIVVCLFAVGGCAGSAHYASLDSMESPCSAEYRAYSDLSPAPAHLSDKDRGRYEDRTHDYHVSQGCQREAQHSVRHEIPDVPGPRVH